MTVLQILLVLAVAGPTALLATNTKLLDATPTIFNVPQSAWISLNGSVSGRLYNGSPLGRPCYDVYHNSSGDYLHQGTDSGCKAAQNTLTHSELLIQDFGSYHNPSFSSCMATGETCVLSPAKANGVTDGTCFQGSIPEYYVKAQNIQDVQSCLRFAKKYKVPITIKNTGHDYKGRSSAPNTLAIWTHNILPSPKIDEKFTANGCGEVAGPVVTYGAGQTFNTLYDFLHSRGYMMVGGSCPTVGASGGWVAGGGYGALSPNYGLGVDNVVQMKVVLPDGSFVTANRCQNQDIFFALRGGGGGTFGVVTETTSKIHKDDRQVTFAILAMNVPKDVRNISEIFVANAVRWAEEGWGGSLGVREGNSAAWIGINFDLGPEAAEESLKPVVDFFKAVSTDKVNFTKSITALPSYYDFQNSTVNHGFVARGIGFMATQASRLIPRSIFESANSQKVLVDALVRQPYGGFFTTPYKFTLPKSDLPGGSGEASITPAWRSSLWHLVYQDVFDPADPALSSPEALKSKFRKVSQDMDRVRSFTQDSGAYQNEADTYEPDPAHSYWGKDNYDRLMKIKHQLDPDNLLSCFRCLGWNAADQRHRCYPKL